MRKTNAVLVTGWLALVMGGCGSDLAGASAAAITEIHVIGNAQESRGQSGEEPGTAAREPRDRVEGTLDVRARVYVQSEAGGWIEVTRGAAEQRVDASGRTGARLLARSEVEVRSYRRVRIEFEEVRGEVTGGILLDTGLGGGAVRLQVGSGGRVVVEREIDLTARAGSVALLEIDLASASWAQGGTGASRVVAESEFASAVRVRVRQVSL
jgi:hypothetical protein